MIGGFLGAGKTTFIRRYRQYLEEKGISYVVLENEFGAAGVDARLLGGNVRELSGGCICCGQKVNFHHLLLELSGQAERIIVEPSGIFSPDDFFDILDTPDVRERLRGGMLAVLVNPFSLETLSAADRDVLKGELLPAGVILLSRLDRAEAAVRSRAEEYLRLLLPEMPPVLDAREADFSALMALEAVRREHVRERVDHSTLFQSASLCPEGTYDGEGLRTVARRLFSGEAGEVLRVKGVVRGEEGFLSLNATSDDWEMKKSFGPAMMNVIGRHLNRRAIRCILEACVMDRKEV